MRKVLWTKRENRKIVAIIKKWSQNLGLSSVSVWSYFVFMAGFQSAAFLILNCPNHKLKEFMIFMLLSVVKCCAEFSWFSGFSLLMAETWFYSLSSHDVKTWRSDDLFVISSSHQKMMDKLRHRKASTNFAEQVEKLLFIR